MFNRNIHYTGYLPHKVFAICLYLKNILPGKATKSVYMYFCVKLRPKLLLGLFKRLNKFVAERVIT